MTTNAVATAVAPMPALPAHLRAKLKPAGESKANAAISAGLGSGFIPVPRISVEGKRFDLVFDGQRITAMTQDSEGNQMPAAGLNVVIVGANAGKYKSFFAEKQADGTYRVKRWVPGQEAERPVCYSYDGEKPSPLAEAPQSATCASCPQNVFGSLINENGNKTRACGDGKLLAVIPLSAVKKRAPADSVAGYAFQVKVSATALSRSREDRKNAPQLAHSLSEYVNMLSNYPVDGGNVEVPVRSVATRLFFAGHTEYTMLQFKLAKEPWLTEEDLAYVEMRAAGDDIKLLVEEQGVPSSQPTPVAIAAPVAQPQLAAPAPAAQPVAPQTAPAPAEAPKPRGRPRNPVAQATATQPAPAPAPVAPAPAPVAPAGVQVLDDEGEFIPAAQAQPPAPKPTPQPAAVPTTQAQDAALAAVADLFN